MGNLTREPELRNLPDGTAVCDITLAINRVSKRADGTKNQETLFMDVTLFGRLGEIASEYLHKGDPAFVMGRLHQETWPDKQTQQPRSKVKVIAENLQLLTGKPASGATQTAQRPPRPASKPQPRPVEDDPEEIFA
jgi:single-strand DNA-binding protein